jgi:hypothetical protein
LVATDGNGASMLTYMSASFAFAASGQLKLFNAVPLNRSSI